MLWYPQTLVFIFHVHVAVSNEGFPTSSCKTQSSKKAYLESIQPNPCSRQRQLQQVAQGSVQLGFQFLRGWRLHKLTSQSVPEFDQPHHKKAFSPLYFIFVSEHIPACGRCVLSLVWEDGAAQVATEKCLQVLRRCVAAAPASCPVGRRALGTSRQWCLPFPPCLWGSRSFQYPKGKAAQSGNTAWQFC